MFDISFIPLLIGKNEMNIDKKNNGNCQKAMLLGNMIRNCNRITYELNRLMKQELSLTLAKFDVLQVIKYSENSEITMSNLSQELSVSNANMTGMTNRLLKDGLIEKKNLQKDRRIFKVALTEKGNNLLKRAGELHGYWTKEIFQSVDLEEVSLVSIFLDKLNRDTENFSKNN